MEFNECSFKDIHCHVFGIEKMANTATSGDLLSLLCYCED